ncbi:SIS domain-containing protein [Enterobacter huaxiensis]|jgi:6-phospho-3-hexuloisomerase|uniref:SIS domain-containing protein n=1 Tax=Enterobacter huaxiensis TaxID=2494702 RepID=A0A3R9Q4X2_9ENTR|nr:6-phospho-3-hexuloisomerase [Enterobacter huaxiensis]RSK69193.1 SIS domain-containing protein [Enterobacter huaxiensis]UNC50417.1 SIS domain-containing protein [Enterobacter huaxiensis]
MKNYSLVMNELSALTGKIDGQEYNAVINAITTANHIFLTGAGRSGQMINALANRLMHLGMSVSVVGEISSPHSHEGDLMIVGSGSGETQRLINQVNIAKKNGVQIALITTSPNSTLAGLADCILTIPAGDSVQPMGSLFEQACLLTYDSIVLALMRNLHETHHTMKARHADIE